MYCSLWPIELFHFEYSSISPHWNMNQFFCVWTLKYGQHQSEREVRSMVEKNLKCAFENAKSQFKFLHSISKSYKLKATAYTLKSDYADKSWNLLIYSMNLAIITFNYLRLCIFHTNARTQTWAMDNGFWFPEQTNTDTIRCYLPIEFGWDELTDFWKIGQSRARLALITKINQIRSGFGHSHLNMGQPRARCVCVCVRFSLIIFNRLKPE